MFDQNQLCKFLLKAKKSTYAAGDQIKKFIEKDKSKTLIFNEGDWHYHDNYFGGEPFGGREVIFYKGLSVYIMVYYGYVDQSIKNVKLVYRFLQRALTQIPADKPFRGPIKYEEDNLVYNNIFTGEIENFFGEETILQDGKEIYKARYVGGLVDQR